MIMPVTKKYKKGRDFELSVAKKLRLAGFSTAKRMPRSGAIEGLQSDLLVPELPFVWELKNQQKWDIKSYMDQVRSNAEQTGKMPVLVAKKNNEVPLVMMELNDWINIIQRAFIENKTPVITGKNSYSKHEQTSGT